MAGSQTVLAIFRPIVWLAVVVLYLLVGGGIFYATESTQIEDVVYHDVVLHTNSTSDTDVKLELADKYNLSGDAIEDIYLKMLHAGRVYAERGLSVRPGWSFLRCCLYSMTVFTTIGYGAWIPSTILGKVLTAFYAIVGIPIFIKYICVFGGVINHLNHFIATKIVTSNRPCRVNTFKTIVSSLLMVVFLFGSTGFHMLGTDWDFRTSLYYSVITFTTIGFGDFVYDPINVNSFCAKSLLICHMVVVFAGFAVLGGVVRAIWDGIKSCENTKRPRNDVAAKKEVKREENAYA